ncbi:CinA family protein [Methylolobus aquaticus]|nr:CinA family protein [Methylolobus aquaticus]
MNDEALIGLAGEVGAALAKRGDTLITAESCTGGGIAETLTAIAGASAWFEAAFVTYSNHAKTELLGVAPEVLVRCGAVSEETVAAMARGALARLGADWAIAISGIAGPTGGSADKPVGTVWIHWSSARGQGCSRCYHFAGDRAAVRRQSIEAALRGLLDALRG